MVRFLHSADWQLGMTRHVLAGDARVRFFDARIDAIRRIGKLAAETRSEFVVVCGDVFESNHIDRRTVARALEALSTITVPVYLLPGNHDPLDAASVYRSAAFRARVPAHVHVLEGGAPVVVAEGIELIGAPWRSKRPDLDLVATACEALPPARGTTRILAAHGAVDALTPTRKEPAAISLAGAEQALGEGRIHYLALGDRHSRTEVGESGRIFYAGTPEPTDFDEIAPGEVLLVDVDPQSVKVSPRTVGTWRFERRGDIHLGDGSDLGALAAYLDGFEAKERTVLRLGLVGELDLRGQARLEALLDEARDLFAGIDLWERETRLVVRPIDDDFRDLELAGFAQQSAEHLRTLALADGSDAATARDALALLMRLTGAAA